MDAGTGKHKEIAKAGAIGDGRQALDAVRDAGWRIARDTGDLEDAMDAGNPFAVEPLLNSLAGWADALHWAALDALTEIGDSKEADAA